MRTYLFFEGRKVDRQVFSQCQDDQIIVSTIVILYLPSPVSMSIQSYSRHINKYTKQEQDLEEGWVHQDRFIFLHFFSIRQFLVSDFQWQYFAAQSVSAAPAPPLPGASQTGCKK